MSSKWKFRFYHPRGKEILFARRPNIKLTECDHTRTCWVSSHLVTDESLPGGCCPSPAALSGLFSHEKAYQVICVTEYNPSSLNSMFGGSSLSVPESVFLLEVKPEQTRDTVLTSLVSVWVDRYFTLSGKDLPPTPLPLKTAFLFYLWGPSDLLTGTLRKNPFASSPLHHLLSVCKTLPPP